MKFAATRFALAIDYKLASKFYNASPFDTAANPTKATTAPFDTEIVLPEHSWELPVSAKFINVRELSGVATPQGGTPK